MPSFSLGRTAITPAALAALAANNVDAVMLFSRQQRGDWGDVPEKRQRYNDLAAQQNHIVRSSYKLPGDREVVVTTAADRSSTLMLLESEDRREVSTLEGYAIWSATYDSEKNSLLAVEEPHVDALLAPLSITTALDVGTGTGRQDESPVCCQQSRKSLR